MKHFLLTMLSTLILSPAFAQMLRPNPQQPPPFMGPNQDIRQLMEILRNQEQRLYNLEARVRDLEYKTTNPIPNPIFDQPPMGYFLYICTIGSSENCYSLDYKFQFNRIIERTSLDYVYNLKQCTEALSQPARFSGEIDSINVNGKHFNIDGYRIAESTRDEIKAKELCYTIGNIFRDVIKDSVKPEPIWDSVRR